MVLTNIGHILMYVTTTHMQLRLLHLMLDECFTGERTQLLLACMGRDCNHLYLHWKGKGDTFSPPGVLGTLSFKNILWTVRCMLGRKMLLDVATFETIKVCDCLGCTVYTCYIFMHRTLACQ